MMWIKVSSSGWVSCAAHGCQLQLAPLEGAGATPRVAFSTKVWLKAT